MPEHPFFPAAAGHKNNFAGIRGRNKNRSSGRLPEYGSLEPRKLLASVQVIAAGVTNQETLELQIDGQTVRTWTSLGGNAYAGQFVNLTHTVAGPLSADRVRLAFTNDLYDPAQNIDRNVRVDAIVIDGVRFETEAPAVFSTGTWRPADGVTPGYRESEYLHANGFFQYSPAPGNSGSSIEIVARGDRGEEQMELQIDGVTVAGYSVTTAGATYRWRAAGTVAASQIRVAFTNDLWDPANGIDRNLVVDRIVVDGVIHETEGPLVYSTGTWQPGDGIQPGFRQSETLHANGYFQYDVVRQFGTVGLQSSVLSVAENAGQIAITVVRTGGSDGTITVDYRTVELTATAGADFTARAGTLTFFEGETSKSITVPVPDDQVVEGNEQFAFTIDNVQGGGSLGAPRTATVTIVDNDAIRAAGNGLLGEYFDSPGFTDRFLNRVDERVFFNWGTGAPAAGMGADTFSVRWTGRIEPRYTETYTFRTRTDDGVRLWVNNQLIIDRWVNQSVTEHSGTIALEAGLLYDIRMEYYENLGAAVAELRWSSPRQALEVVPRSQLYAADPPPVTPGNQLRTQNLYSGLVQPTAVDFSPDGANVYIAEQRGIVRVARNGNLLATPFLDFRDRVNGTRDRGLLDIAVHPNFAAQPYVYLLYTYDPPEVNSYAAGTLAGPDGNGNRAGRLTRVTADAATNYTTIVPGSEVVLIGGNSTWNNFNAFVNSTVNFQEPPAGILPGGGNLQDFIATDSESHTVGAIEFGVDGALYVSIGDGTSYNQVDPRTSRVQDIDNLSGKILRVDPLTGRGLSSNPFWNGNPDANRSKVWQSGLRNPFRMAVHPVSGSVYIGDVGWTQWEEINVAAAGANFGWPWYEGGSGTSLRTGGYQNLAAAQAFYASGQTVTPSLYALNHAATGINAIVLGDVYSGNVFPTQYRNNLFFGDLGQGIIRNIRFNPNGSIAAVEQFATGHRYVVQMKQGRDGNLYFVDLDDGIVGRWTFAQSGSASATAVAAAGAPALGLAGGTGGAGVVIASIDSGLDPSRPWLAGQLWVNPGEIPGDGVDNDGNGLADDVHGWDFVGGTGAVSDSLGHGTLVASLLAGNGAEGQWGIAPQAQLMPLRVLDGTGQGDGAAVARAIRYAVDKGARIVSLSVSLDRDLTAVRDAVAWAESRGVLVMAAAGNEGLSQPAALARLSASFANVLSVGAVGPDGARLPESSRMGNEGAVQIDAPGMVFGPAPQGGTVAWRGTSVATALAAGAAARTWALNPDLNARQVRELLVATAGRAGSGSDSLGTLDVARASALSSRLREVQFTVDGTRLLVGLTAGDDEVRYGVEESRIIINGVGYSCAGKSAFPIVVLDGRSGTDRLVLVGTQSGSDYGLLRADHASLTTAGQFVRGTGFERIRLIAGDGNSLVDLHDSAGNDRASFADGMVTLEAGGAVFQAAGFRNSRVHASAGQDTAELRGSAADERLVARPWFTRLVRGPFMVQVNGFDSVTAAMGGGFDSVIFEGSYLPERLWIGPRWGRMSGTGFAVEATGLEQTTSYGHGGYDEAQVQDGPGRDIINSSPLNTLLVGPAYDHRLWSFERTVITSSGGTDHATLRGSSGGELLESGPVSTRLTGSGLVTELAGFPSVLVFGEGGADEAVVIGSSDNDWFWATPTQSVLNGPGRTLSVRQFGETRFDGGGGNDVVALVDGAGSDRLRLWRDRAELAGAGYRIETRGHARLRATSQIDAAPDDVRYEEATLDYVFERFGDWVLAG